MSKQNLFFLNPEINPGKNLTVRRGIKWADASGELNVYMTGESLDMPRTRVRVLETKVIPFDSLCNNDLVFEHDSGCRTTEGLEQAMKKAYPGFDTREVVTLLFFEEIDF
jgi:hypothetical protein